VVLVAVLAGTAAAVEAQQSELAADVAAADLTEDTALWLVIALSALAFVVTAGAAVLAVAVVRPLAALGASARALTSGDVKARAKASGPEDVASLTRGFNEMTDALSAKTEEYIDATNLTGVTLLRVDKDNRVSFINDAMCEFLGRTREEILGTPIAEYLHPDDVASTIQAVRQMVESKRLARGIMSRYVTPMGTRVTEWNGYPLFDEDGRYAGVHGAGRDITKRKRAEEALRESEERYRELADSITDVFFAMDRDLRYTYWNKASEELTGISAQDAIGKCLYELFPEVKGTKADTLYHEVLRTREPRSFVNEYQLEGKNFSFEISAYPSETGLSVFVKDISERKRAEEALRESEQRFRTLSEATFEGVAIHKKGRILVANQTLAEMFGYQLSEVVGMRPVDFVAPESRDPVLYATRSGYEEPFELIGLRKDRSTFPIEARGKTTRYQGRTVGVATMRDLSKRKRAEEALQKARDELESRVERRMRQVNGYGLTFRELAVLHLVAAGESDKEIAAVLGISPLTAHKHLANILEKMGAACRTEAGVRALREGLLD
jgi:PAS domain S-box-containing protein